jgi:hypothetical protein
MDDAKTIWSLWQSMLESCQPCFTRGGWVRFAQWVTGMVLCDEEHTITQSLTSCAAADRWRVIEHFAEYGSWDRPAVERQLERLVASESPQTFAGYRVVALDDTKEHRTSPDVWGTCTFHESTARSPNRAETVRAHNWVVLGSLTPGQPWDYAPLASRLYFRREQLPVGETFRTKTELAVELFQQADEESTKPVLAAFDGAYANRAVIGPLLAPPRARRRIQFVTRLRKDARLYAPVTRARSPRGGRPRKWGRRLPAPEKHTQWNTPWKNGRTYLYGRLRKFRCQQLECRWSVTGPDEPVVVYAFLVEGYEKPWYLVTSARDLTPAQVVAVFAARFRQEDGFRDHKQRLGMEECRTWTKEPVLRTFQVQLVAQALLRLMPRKLAQPRQGTWWTPPPWNPDKQHPSLLDVRRLLWRHRGQFSHFILRLEKFAKPPQAHFPCGRTKTRAA